MQYFSGLGKVGIDKQRRFNMERVLQINLVRFDMERAGACTPERATEHGVGAVVLVGRLK